VWTSGKFARFLNLDQPTTPNADLAASLAAAGAEGAVEDAAVRRQNTAGLSTVPDPLPSLYVHEGGQVGSRQQWESGAPSHMEPRVYRFADCRQEEVLALRIEKHISNDRQTLYIRQQRKKDGSGVTDVFKTPAAYRDIDLHSSLAKMLDDFIGDRENGFLIQTENGTMLSPESFFRDGLESVLKKMGRTGVRFHAFRRFREATLQKSEGRRLLIDYWMGHENDEMSTRYGKQLLEDVKYRKEWAEKVGLGFDPPTSNPGLFGLRGLQNVDCLSSGCSPSMHNKRAARPPRRTASLSGSHHRVSSAP